MLQVKLSGSVFNEQCTLLYFDEEIYKGYVDDLVTSENGYLVLNLNYGTEVKLAARIKRIGNIFLLIPIDGHKYSIWVKNFKPIVMSLNEIKFIWESFRYTFDDDQKFIFNATFCDIFLTWILSSKINCNQGDKKNIIKTFKEKVSYIPEGISDIVASLDELLDKNRDIKQNEFSLKITAKNIVTIYLYEDGKFIDWEAILENNLGNFYMNLLEYYVMLPNPENMKLA